MREKQTNFVGPWKEIDQQHTDYVRNEPGCADVGASVLEVRRYSHADPDGDNFDHSIDTTEKRSLEVRKAERGHDDGALVRQTVWNVVDSGEQREEPRLGICESFVEPRVNVSRLEEVRQFLDVLFYLEVLVLDTSLVSLKILSVILSRSHGP